VVDRYGEYLVAQFLSQGAERLQGLVCESLVDLLHPVGILARNDARVRRLEGLEQRVDLLYGDVPEEILVREGDLEYGVRPWTGQKTGAFLDQRENRAAVRGYARGRALDCFAYHGAFALQLARATDRVIAIESSPEAAEILQSNAARNGVAIDVRVANVFDVLRAFDRAGERFDTIVLDPPAFAKNRASVPKAEAGYKEINLRALRLLAPGGVLLTCTCSHHVGDARFEEILIDAARDARVSVTLVEKRMQSRDHPVLLTVPETRYLTCLILRRLA
jgi:23S rRNA (cytosine1962-C5)-methyltransferase